MSRVSKLFILLIFYLLLVDSTYINNFESYCKRNQDIEICSQIDSQKNTIKIKINNRSYDTIYYCKFRWHSLTTSPNSDKDWNEAIISNYESNSSIVYPINLNKLSPNDSINFIIDHEKKLNIFTGYDKHNINSFTIQFSFFRGYPEFPFEFTKDGIRINSNQNYKGFNITLKNYDFTYNIDTNEIPKK